MDRGIIVNESKTTIWKSLPLRWKENILKDVKILFTVEPALYADKVPPPSAENQAHTGIVFLPLL